MALSEDEKRRRARERKARYRAAQAAKPKLVGIAGGAAGRDSSSGTDDGTTAGTSRGTADGDDFEPFSNVAAARDALRAMVIPASAKPLAAIVMTLAADLDGRLNTPQRSSLVRRYLEAMTKLEAACETREVDELDEMRRRFYAGEVPDGGDAYSDEDDGVEAHA